MYALVAAWLGSVLARPSAQTEVSGIVSYVYEPNPREITPKLYNWEIRLSSDDSRHGPYEIVQITTPLDAGSNARDTAPTVLIDSGMIVPDLDGIIDFRLYIGDKEPRPNMPRRGSVGLPIIFSGIGTARGQSNWIYLPGLKVERATPSGRGVQLAGGSLDLIRFVVVNAAGAKFQSDIVMRRK